MGALAFGPPKLARKLRAASRASTTGFVTDRTDFVTAGGAPRAAPEAIDSSDSASDVLRLAGRVADG
jgi:hypothetical protein